MTAPICSNPVGHRPRPVVLQVHHSPPRSWTPDDGASSTLVPLCGSCHDAEHALLNLCVHYGGPDHLPAGEAMRFTKYLRDLAASAWARRPSDRPPYTETHP